MAELLAQCAVFVKLYKCIRVFKECSIKSYLQIDTQQVNTETFATAVSDNQKWVTE